jgi:hypothetical protein
MIWRFHVGISVVLAGSIMTVARNGFMRREPFERRIVIGVKPPLVVVDEHRRREVHGVDEREAFSNGTLLQGGLDLRGNVEKRPAALASRTKVPCDTPSQSSFDSQ